MNSATRTTPMRKTLPANLQHTADFIQRVQLASGAIPWFDSGITDPWDHVEAAMGLTVAGLYDAAERALDWLANQQRDDGAWFAAYDSNGIADDTRAETNFVAYIATGVWHHVLVTDNRTVAKRLWPTVQRALDFVVQLQAPTGEIYWALDSKKGVSKDALITGCSSIYKSLQCGIALAGYLGHPAETWVSAREALGDALRSKPERFDRTWESKERYAMDWFYPVLTGVVTGASAQQRLADKWQTFVEPDHGCRCVSDQPWATAAETAELIMACVAVGDTKQGQALTDAIAKMETNDGSWWTGYVFTDDVFWPDERPTWTAGAILLAADAMQGLTPACRLLSGASAEPTQIC